MRCCFLFVISCLTHELQIIDGNMIIKMAVKDTPALIGNKLNNHYFKVDFFLQYVLGISRLKYFLELNRVTITLSSMWTLRLPVSQEMSPALPWVIRRRLSLTWDFVYRYTIVFFLRSYCKSNLVLLSGWCRGWIARSVDGRMHLCSFRCVDREKNLTLNCSWLKNIDQVVMMKK